MAHTTIVETLGADLPVSLLEFLHLLALRGCCHAFVGRPFLAAAAFPGGLETIRTSGEPFLTLPEQLQWVKGSRPLERRLAGRNARPTLDVDAVWVWAWQAA